MADLIHRKRILFIGNSFTNRNDLPATIARLAEAADRSWKIESERVIANGMSLKTHWTRGEAAEMIRKREWDYVVLQEQSTLPLKNRPKMHEYIRRFDQVIRDRGARTVLYLTWARQASLDRQPELTEAYVSVGREIGAIVAPVGVAWQRLSGQKKPLALYDRDGSHPNAAGSYLAACVFVGELLRVNPIGLPGIEVLQPALVATLQKAAWKTIQEFSKTGD